MLKLWKLYRFVGAFLVVAPVSAAWADEKPQPPSELPPVTSTHDPHPVAPTLPVNVEPEVVRQAGVGSPVAYARSNVLELGGSLTLAASTAATELALSPSIGWFIMDNVELSLLLRTAYSNIKGTEKSPEVKSHYITFLLEPSLHIPVGSDTLFAFGGVGIGATHIKDRQGLGFAIAPRLGLNVAVGRSGFLSPSLGLNWSSSSAIATPQGQLLAVNTSWGANIGYSVMW